MIFLLTDAPRDDRGASPVFPQQLSCTFFNFSLDLFRHAYF